MIPFLKKTEPVNMKETIYSVKDNLSESFFFSKKVFGLTNNIRTFRKIFFAFVYLIFSVIFPGCNKNSGEKDLLKRQEYLDHLISTFRSNIEGEEPREHPIWESWLKRSGELPPDFDQLETNAFPPDLLTLKNGNKISDPAQWPERKQEIKDILQQYMFGNWPPPPSKIAIKYENSKEEETSTYYKQNVQLRFSPSINAVEFAEKYQSYDLSLSPQNMRDRSNQTLALLNVELLVPKGEGPFPAIIELGPSFPSRDIPRLNRGYIVARFNRLDADYFAAVYTDYECNQLEWWAYAACRCIDLLYSRSDVDKSKIALAGHSRGAKTALIATVMDERVNALINSHPGTGAGSYNLWRYTEEKYGGEHLENSTRRFPYWNNPRMRFFMGRTNKMPFDSHFLQALAAPVPVLMGTGERDNVGQAWGDQQCYLAVKEVYRLLGKEQNLGFYPSPGGHTVTPVMVEDQLDWLDMQFGRKPFNFKENLIYTYNFDKWKNISNEKLNIEEFPEKDLNDILIDPNGKTIQSIDEWKSKSLLIKSHIEQIIGKLPEYDKSEDITLQNITKTRGNLIKAEIPINEKLIAYVTYPADRKEKIPAVIYLHAYLDAQGYNWSRGYGYRISVGERLAQNGFLAVEFDQFGYSSRNRDSGIEFYEENPDISALGVMIQDVSKIIDALSNIEWVNKEKIMVTGFSLGGLVALYSAVYDERISAVASNSGFASMRRDVHGNQTEGIKRYSHLRPTIPRLGLFLGNEKRIPYDFHEILALIAPRPVYILAPALDQDWFFEDVEICYHEAQKIYELYGKKDKLVLYSPNDFNRHSSEYQQLICDWLLSHSK